MTVIKKIDVMSFAKFQAVIMMFMVALMGLLQIGFLAIFSSVASQSAEGAMAGGAFAGGAAAGMGLLGLLIAVPVMGIISFVLSIIGAWFANIVLGWIGGIKVEMHQA